MSEMNNFSELNEFQKKSFLIFKKFHDFCLEHNLRYCLLGGSVLGAVRHKGFIPWDDDIDVGLPREDYNRLIKIINKIPSPFVGDFPEFDEEFYLDFGKIYDSNTTVIEDTPVRLKRGVWIDIFPLDGAFEVGYKRRIHKFSIDFLRNLLKIKRGLILYKDRGFTKNLAFLILKKSVDYFDVRKIVGVLDFVLSFKSLNNSEYIANYLGRWGDKEIQRKENYLEFSSCYFVDDFYPVPAKVNEYLKSMYGDYMTLPDMDKRNSGHVFLEIDLNKSFLIESDNE